MRLGRPAVLAPAFDPDGVDPSTVEVTFMDFRRRDVLGHAVGLQLFLVVVSTGVAHHRSQRRAQLSQSPWGLQTCHGQFVLLRSWDC